MIGAGGTAGYNALNEPGPPGAPTRVTVALRPNLAACHTQSADRLAGPGRPFRPHPAVINAFAFKFHPTDIPESSFLPSISFGSSVYTDEDDTRSKEILIQMNPEVNCSGLLDHQHF